MKYMGALTLCLIITVCRGESNIKPVPVYVKPAHFGGRIVILIRHGEKITDEDPSLSERGKARAEYLKKFFGNSKSRPRQIFAQRSDEKHRSVRPRETVRPLAHARGIPLNIDVKAKDTKKLAELISGLGREKYPVLVCWSHRRIGQIASYLLGRDTGNFPKGYDTVWTIDLEKRELAVSSQGF